MVKRYVLLAVHLGGFLLRRLWAVVLSSTYDLNFKVGKELTYTQGSRAVE